MSDNETIDPQAFRSALGAYATGVTVITTRDRDGNNVGMTASSFTSLSLDPPLILWSIDKRTGCFDVFNEAEHFAIHVLKDSQEELSNHFAGRGFDKFKDIASTEGVGGAPILADYSACFQCSTEHRYEGGDHIIIVGRVLSFEEHPSKPLIFCQGKYAHIA